jgi:adenylate cyclase
MEAQVATNDDIPWASVLGGLSGSRPTQRSGLYDAFWGAPIPITSRPEQPAATTSSRIQQAEERFEKRLARLRDILPVRTGRVVPDDDDLMIGDARRLKLAVLFLDICKFSQISNEDPDQQDQVLKLLNLFMAEMLQIVKMHGGEFEKNTGDGLMAYFNEASEPQSAMRAVDAAVTMHCYNDQVISPRLQRIGLPKIRFRVGIETGLVTIANVGVHGGSHRSLVAIGTTPNIACKLMTLIDNGGIVIGNRTRDFLSEDWKKETTSLGSLPGFVLKGTNNPYPAWELNYRVPVLTNWALALSGMPDAK